ncbi:hypothetical protein AYO47_06435 [Planctomyces sp. SCGC AG-212-M04]|nr:hypothetical protein AYO47_06435 [Planctomyces sp. SCGC AG-212-M04]
MRSLSIVVALLLIAIVGGAAAWTYVGAPMLAQSGEHARRVVSQANLKAIGLAIHQYHKVNRALPNGTFPSTTLKPEERLSWQAAILPYIEQAALAKQLDPNAAWDQGANATFSKSDVKTFRDPKLGIANPGATSYVGLAGVGPDGPMLEASDKKAGIFAYDSPRSIRDCRDGTSNTIWVAESSRPAFWAQGGPSTIRPLTTTPYLGGPDGIGGVSVGGTNVFVGDGQVRFINNKIDPKLMEALTTINGGENLKDFEANPFEK